MLTPLLDRYIARNGGSLRINIRLLNIARMQDREEVGVGMVKSISNQLCVLAGLAKVTHCDRLRSLKDGVIDWYVVVFLGRC